MPRVAARDCVKGIQSMVKNGTLTDIQADEIVVRMGNLAKDRAAKKNIKLDDALKEIEGEIIGSLKFEQRVQRRNELLTIKAKREVKDFVSKFDTPGEGLRAYLEGGLTPTEGARLSVDYRAKSLYHQYFGSFTAELEKQGLIRSFRSGKLDREIYMEIAALNTKGGTPGISKNADAQKIAQAYHRVHKDMIGRQNRAGAYIQDLDGYIMRQTHDTGEIQALGRMPDGSLSMKESAKKWKLAVLPLLDQAKTFRGLPPDSFLDKVHTNLYTGVHKNAGDEAEIAEFFAHGSMARSASAHRVLHFKDAESAFQYNQMFGTKNFSDGVLSDMLFRSRNITMMESFGPNPKQTFDSLLGELDAEYKTRDNSAELTKSLDDWRIRAAWNEVSGSDEYPANLTLDKISSTVRAFTQLSKMGGVVISSLGDKAFLHSEMTFQGMSGLQTLAKQILGMIPRGVDQKATLHQMGIAMDSMIGNTISRYTIHSRGTGTLNKVQQRFYDLNFMNWWNDVHKASAGELMAAHLASNSHLDWAKVNPEIQKTLKLYGIGDLEWQALRHAVDVAPNGEKYMTPSSMHLIPLSTIDALVHAKGQKVSNVSRDRMRDSLEEKLRVYFADRIDMAVPTPGAAERKYLTFGTQAGTPLGEGLRLLTMFKSFPLTVTRKIAGREVYGGGSKNVMDFIKHDHKGKFRLAQLIAMTTVGGYISGAIKDAIRGRTPKPLVTEDGEINWKTVNHAFLRGGGAGIFGDFLFSEYDQSYNSFVGAAAGPVFGQVDVAAAGLSKAIRGEDPTKEGSKLILNNLPFINLFYIRPVLDYFVLWNIQEMVSPGYVDRMSESVEEQGQEFTVDPRDAVK